MFSKIAMLSSVFTANAHVIHDTNYDEFGVPMNLSQLNSINLPHFGLLDDFDENMNLVNLANIENGSAIVSG